MDKGYQGRKTIGRGWGGRGQLRQMRDSGDERRGEGRGGGEARGPTASI